MLSRLLQSTMLCLRLSINIAYLTNAWLSRSDMSQPARAEVSSQAGQRLAFPAGTCS